MEKIIKKAQLGLVGLAVMGENLALNFERHGFCVALANRSPEKVDRFLAGRGKGLNFIGCRNWANFVAALEKPRKIMLMVKAGEPVDAVLADLRPYLEPGDILIDGGNSHYPDTIRRCRELEARGLHFVGTGVSGGELGALYGPSLMPGGSAEVRDVVLPLLERIAARGMEDRPCCSWIGTDGAGHFVKMVHNGIEYGDMQLISEAYALLRHPGGLDGGALAEAFSRWNEGELASYLVEITGDILRRRDPESGKLLVDMILDCAGQKGTGRWTASAALDFGAAAPTLAEAVFARTLSGEKELRLQGELLFGAPDTLHVTDRPDWVEKVRQALYAAKICSYAQGFDLLHRAAAACRWQLDYAEIARIWSGGCIIRAKLLELIVAAYRRDPELDNLIFDDDFAAVLRKCAPAWREVTAMALVCGIPVPGLAASLSWFDALRTGRSAASLIQAQRDYFGAHTYERIDRPRGEFFHTAWTEESGSTTAGTYNAGPDGGGI